MSQTIIQLHRQALEAGYDEASLERLRNAYGLACRLFVGRYRVSGKPFSAHLVGTASAVVRWREAPELAAAGLLHSAYRFGTFGDRTRALTAAKREALRSRIGRDAEELVARFTQEASWTSVDAMRDAAAGEGRELVVLELANLLDDCVDAGPCFAPAKSLLFGLPADGVARQGVLDVAASVVGEVARRDFEAVFEAIDSTVVPDCLVSAEPRQFEVEGGLEELASPRWRKWLPFARGLKLHGG